MATKKTAKRPARKVAKADRPPAAPIDAGSLIRIRTVDDFPRIGPLLKQLREARGVRLMDMARGTGFDKGQLSRLEAGGNPRIETIYRYLDALGLELVFDALPASGLIGTIQPKKTR